MEYILGIDQGASKTHAVIGDCAGALYGFGKSHGACHSSNGIEYAMEAVCQAAQQAMAQAGIAQDEIGMISAGMTGVDWDHEARLLTEAILHQFPGREIRVVNDCIIAMRAGTKEKYGAVLCAGSGLNCAVRSEAGLEFVYGFYIDDEFQGGSGLGRAAVRAVIDTQVGLAEAKELKELVLKELQCENVEELLCKRVAGGLTMQDYLRLPLVLEEAAALGDQEANRILYRFGVQFARYVTVALKRMDMLRIPVEVVLSGSIFKCREPKLLQGVRDCLTREAPNAALVNAAYEPVVGAYLLGLDAVGCDTGKCRRLVEEGCEKFPLKRETLTCQPCGKERENGRINA